MKAMLTLLFCALASSAAAADVVLAVSMPTSNAPVGAAPSTAYTFLHLSPAGEALLPSPASPSAQVPPAAEVFVAECEQRMPEGQSIDPAPGVCGPLHVHAAPHDDGGFLYAWRTEAGWNLQRRAGPEPAADVHAEWLAESGNAPGELSIIVHDGTNKFRGGKVQIAEAQ